jgi:DNA primase
MDAVSEIKGRLSIEDVIGEYVQLKRAGRNFKAKSPFTTEKTPSFIVSPEKQIWHDFSSGKGGDIFSFIMEYEGVEFKAALELLARKSGVELEQFSGQGRKGPSKDRLYEVLDLTAKFYQLHFQKKDKALEYIFKKRRFNKQTVLEFRIGYSPNNQSSLIDFLAKRGFSPEEIKTAGLSTVRGNRPTDMFRGRIMVPLMDQFGKVIGFTARLLEDNDNAPKYINTPATILYDKSRHVYGMHLAKKAIKDNNYSVIAEGNLDVVASHQAGIKNVVATAGTAITEYQLKALARLSPEVRLAFDQDRAGLAAAERAIPIASKAKANLSIITMPAGKDPDELIQQGKELWQKAIDDKQYALDWLMERYKDKIDLNSAQGKREFTDIVLNVVKNLSDEVEKDHYISKIAELADVSPESVREKLTKNAPQQPIYKQPKPIKKQSQESPPDKDWQRAADRLLCLGLMLPPIRKNLEIMSPEMFQSDQSKKLFKFLIENPEFSGSAEEAKQLKSVYDYVKILSLQFEELYGDVDMLELHYEATRLRAKTIQCFVKQQKTLLSARLTESPEERDLLERSRELDRLLNKLKE